MSDFLLINADKAIFELNQGDAIMLGPVPGPITASGPPGLDGKKLCLEGDESSVSVSCQYMTPKFTTPGSGKLTIANLNGNQIAKNPRTK